MEGSISAPYSTNYHNAYDLQKATGVEFPEVIAIDSIQTDNFCNSSTRVTFVTKKKRHKDFLDRLDKACKDDPQCWSKEGGKYIYDIYPVPNLDRTKKDVSPFRMADSDGDGKYDTYDWDGDYIEVIVSAKGDTITIEEGWRR